MSVALALGGLRVAKHIWDASKHPRSPSNGRFVPKGKLSFRVSPRSATVQYGHTLPVIPGKVNLYVGGLARLERDRAHQFGFEKKLSSAGSKLLGKVPDSKFKQVALQAYKSGKVGGPAGTQVSFTKPKVRQPTIKTSKSFSNKGGSGAKSVKGLTNSSVPTVKKRRPQRRKSAVTKRPARPAVQSSGRKVSP